MDAERLFCRCGIEVAVVRLNATTLTFGHRQNPKDKHHRVRLARPAQDTRGSRSVVTPERIEGPNSREDARSLDPGLTTRTTRSESKGLPRSRVTPSEVSSPNPPRGGRTRAPSAVERSSERQAATSSPGAGALDTAGGTAG